ncbi:MAG: hypothetical protein AUK48_15550 [Oscillatoriales cyanobacterium CG2_30_44_21]|nr:MAG: hypothetical protein AUK48_15550 [Oscillatoriales cyanobacterium CG2_30_44_21]
MGIARRKFLQAGLASLIGWQLPTRDRVAFAAEQYARQAIASKHKLALLIGINQYSDVNSTSKLALRGCLNDVELQKELLIYRFGFAPQDIVTLTDSAATRANIASAITEHLIAQTLPDDLVIVHFSGYGSRLGEYNTLVPVDSGLSPNLESLQDITELEWQNWMQTIATDRLVNIIDAGFYYPNSSNLSTVSNFRWRSRIGLKSWQPTLVDGAMPSTKGVTLRAAAGEMPCIDAQWTGFSSGAFTYALVQQLWQIMPATTIYVVMNDVVTTIDRRAIHTDSIPIEQQIANMWKVDQAIEVKVSKSKSIASDTFDVFPIPAFSADGVITATTSDRRGADVSLAGLPITVLNNYGVGSILSTANPLDPKVLLQLKAGNGFNGRVEVISDRSANSKIEANTESKIGQGLITGIQLQEAVRAIARNTKLAIAIDTGLSKIERVDATSALSTLPNMYGVSANEQSVDCLFGTQSASYGLFTIGRTPILGSFGSVGESVGVALKRLQPFLDSLLAAKLLRITENQASAHLDVRTTLRAAIRVDARPVNIASKSSARASSVPPSSLDNTIRTKPINIGDRLECQIENFSEKPLYTRIFCLDPRSKILTPNFTAIPYASDGIIPPQSTLTIPYPKTMNWAVSAPKGTVDVFVVISQSPLTEVSQSLETSQRQASSLNGLISISNPLQVIQSLLNDLDRAYKSADFMSTSGDVWMLDVNQWTTFSFNYQVA